MALQTTTFLRLLLGERMMTKRLREGGVMIQCMFRRGRQQRDQRPSRASTKKGASQSTVDICIHIFTVLDCADVCGLKVGKALEDSLSVHQLLGHETSSSNHCKTAIIELLGLHQLE